MLGGSSYFFERNSDGCPYYKEFYCRLLHWQNAGQKNNSWWGQAYVVNIIQKMVGTTPHVPKNFEPKIPKYVRWPCK